MKFRGGLIFVMLFALGLPSAVWADDRTALVTSDLNVIIYSGEINAKGVAEFKSALRDGKPREFAIRSQGGDVNAAVEIASLLHKGSLHVRVVDYCLSACANYIFPAGATQELPDGAVLGMHGGPTTKILKALKSLKVSDDLRRAVEMAVRPAVDFYATIGMSDKLVECSAKLAATAPNVTVSTDGFQLSGVSDSVVFLPTRAQLESVGLRGIQKFHQPTSVAQARSTFAAVGLEGLVPVFSDCN